MLGFGNKKQNLNQQQVPYNMTPNNMSYGGEYAGGQQTNVPPNALNPQPAQQPQIPQNNIEDYITQRNTEIDRQVEEFTRKNPNFDMRREIQNPQFCNYVWGNGLSVEDAYFLVHRNDTESMNYSPNRMPEKRISENGTGRGVGGGMVKKNPNDLSDDEVDDIVKRVRNGEKISF